MAWLNSLVSASKSYRNNFVSTLSSIKALLHLKRFRATCLVNSLWHKLTECKAGWKFVGRLSTIKFCGKVVFSRTRLTNVSFVLPTHQKSFRHLFRDSFFCGRNANCYLGNAKKKQDWLFSILSNKLRQHQDEDENKVTYPSRTKPYPSSLSFSVLGLKLSIISRREACAVTNLHRDK